MDKNAKSKKGGKVDEPSWKSQCKRLLEIKEEFGNHIQSLSLRLPFGHSPTIAAQIRETGQTFGFLKEDILVSGSKHSKQMHFLTFNLCRDRKDPHQLRVYLEQTFPGKIPKQLISKNSGFSYAWTTRRVTIQRFLATESLEIIEEQIAQLMAECNRFYFLYCA